MGAQLEELLGDYLSLHRQGKLSDYGNPQPHSHSLPVPDHIRKELETQLTTVLRQAHAVRNTRTISEFVTACSVLSTGARYCTNLAWQFPNADSTFQIYVQIPHQLLDALHPLMEERTQKYAAELQRAFTKYRRQFDACAPSAYSSQRKKMDTLLADYTKLQRMESLLETRLHCGNISRYARRYRELRNHYRRVLVPIRTEYLNTDWKNSLRLAALCDALRPLEKKCRASGLVFRDHFPDYLLEVETLRTTMEFHQRYVGEILQLRSALRAALQSMVHGIAVPVAIPASLEALPYLQEDIQRYHAALRVRRKIKSPEISEPFSLSLYVQALGHPSPALFTARHALLQPTALAERIQAFLRALPSPLSPSDAEYVEQIYAGITRIRDKSAIALLRGRFQVQAA